MMNALIARILLCLPLLIFVTPGPLYAATNVEISEELTTLYRAARKVISDNQGHINNAAIGDKGLSGEVVAAKTLENYQAATGKTISKAKMSQAQAAMLNAVKKVMDDNQDLINEKGTGLKGFLPAIFARQVATAFSLDMKGKMNIKLTAPKKYVRNRANRPDKWEHNVVETVFKNPDYEKGKSFYEDTKVKGKSAFRFILPEYYGPSCLGCHGSPKGERDITGGKKEGGVLNELGGAISLTIFH
ncbi:Tll0287-like domain-containing protein [Thalassomonas actiniarum]|uniref:DUF3365 domain-containing protein n=1 Tax=Thalassomonas actiniarum TaxID=485447 RepID=A0AAE9YSU0_9GAMM|nr:DUF3365 domain-containing protein [Thalassomonas actiniarum]WDE00093.1 DUF3365 domain-containing protein [Thalassomonas actiniarum]